MAGADEYAKWIVDNESKKGTPEFDTVAQAYKLAKMKDLKDTGATGPVKPYETSKEMSWQNPDIAPAHPIARMLTGVGRGLMGVLELKSKLRGDTHLSDELKKFDEKQIQARKEVGSEGFDWWKGAGTLGDPTLYLGGGRVARTAGERILSGTRSGAIAGATQPVMSNDDYWGKKGEQIVQGSALGAAVPSSIEAARHGGKALGRASDLITPGGPARIAERHEQRISEPNHIPLIDALERARNVVPGSQPTSAQAVAHLPEGSPIIAQEKITAQYPGGPSASFGTRFKEQQDARERALGKLANTANDERRDVAEALQRRLYDPISQRETPTKFLSAIEDDADFTKSVTGIKRNLDSLFPNKQHNRLMDVAREVGTNVSVRNPIQKTNLGGGVNIPQETNTQLPRMLSVPMTIANTVLKAMGRNIEPRVEAELARMHLNPQELAEALKRAGPGKADQIIDAILKHTPVMSGQAAAQTLQENQ